MSTTTASAGPSSTGVVTSGPHIPAITGKAPHQSATSKKPRRRQRTKGGLWREEVLDRAGRLQVDLDLLAPEHAGESGYVIGRKEVNAVMALTHRHLNPVEWWSGSRIEECWRRLHQAEEAMLDAGSDVVKLANIREARNQATYYLGAEDPRTKNLATMLDTKPHQSVTHMVPTARIALAASHESSDRRHRESRSFINTLRVTIVLLAVFVGAFLVAVDVSNLTFLPEVDQVSQTVLVVVAVLFGALGAMFSAIPSLAQMPSKAETFNPVRTQAVLKVVVGSWSAVIGLMAVAANLTTAKTETVAGFAMVAAIFGAGQEAITRFADRKARDLGTSDSPGTKST